MKSVCLEDTEPNSPSLPPHKPGVQMELENRTGLTRIPNSVCLGALCLRVLGPWEVAKPL